MSKRGPFHVLSAGLVNVPETNAEALQVVTDNPNRAEAGIYLDKDSPGPSVGVAISWEGHRAWWGNTQARRVEYAFDPDAPLR